MGLEEPKNDTYGISHSVPIAVGASRKKYEGTENSDTQTSNSAPIRFTYLEDSQLPFTADAGNALHRQFRDDSQSMDLKMDHLNRPCWVCADGSLYLEMFLPVSKQASDFLLTIAEPICRPELLHEFQITIFSLYAAISIGLSLEDLLNNLNKFSKNEIPAPLVKCIQKHAQAFGKVKLVLRDNKYWVEADDPAELDHLLKSQVIRDARILAVDNAWMTDIKTDSSDYIDVTDLATAGASAHLAHSTQSSLSPFSETNASLLSKEIKPVEQCNGNASQSSMDAFSESTSHNAYDTGYVTRAAPVLDTSQLAFKLTENDYGESESLANARSTKSQEEDAVELDQGTTPAPKLHQVFAFEVQQEKIEDVKRQALEAVHRPLVMEYDFRKDKRNPTLDCSLTCTTSIRYYQERALRKMFSNGRARSGIIVLPCGAGKTLTGITAACTMRKSVMVLTTSAVSVDQWKRQFLEFTSVSPDVVKQLTSDSKPDLWSPDRGGVLISTYTMMAFSGKRSLAADRIMQQVRTRDWGLLIFDEVQFAPAPAFRKINESVRSHCKLGLTATLVREDDLIRDLQWLIGPKLYEANWLELQDRGFLARVTCQEVWCPMTSAFFREYIRAGCLSQFSHARQRKLWVCNPNKMMACEFLLKYHEARGDKVIVFSDNVFALLHAAKSLQRPFIYGKVSPSERMVLLSKFKNELKFNTMFLSKVGDNAIDIPCANVVIQISFNFASRRQEAQRLGRILRPKPVSEDGGFNAFFYSLVSKDTQEMMYADKRQQFIIDQGYSYTVLHSRDLPMQASQLVYGSAEKQQELLREIVTSDDHESDDEEEDDQTTMGGANADSAVQVMHLSGGLAALSGSSRSKDWSDSLSHSGPPNKRQATAKLQSSKTKKESHPFFKKHGFGRN